MNIFPKKSRANDADRCLISESNPCSRALSIEMRTIFLLFWLPVAVLLSGCFTLKPNNRRDGVVLMEMPLGPAGSAPPVSTTSTPPRAPTASERAANPR
jgi:hypothetical protein